MDTNSRMVTRSRVSSSLVGNSPPVQLHHNSFVDDDLEQVTSKKTKRTKTHKKKRRVDSDTQLSSPPLSPEKLPVSSKRVRFATGASADPVSPSDAVARSQARPDRHSGYWASALAQYPYLAGHGAVASHSARVLPLRGSEVAPPMVLPPVGPLLPASDDIDDSVPRQRPSRLRKRGKRSRQSILPVQQELDSPVYQQEPSSPVPQQELPVQPRSPIRQTQPRAAAGVPQFRHITLHNEKRRQLFLHQLIDWKYTGHDSAFFDARFALSIITASDNVNYAKHIGRDVCDYDRFRYPHQQIAMDLGARLYARDGINNVSELDLIRRGVDHAPDLVRLDYVLLIDDLLSESDLSLPAADKAELSSLAERLAPVIDFTYGSESRRPVLNDFQHLRSTDSLENHNFLADFYRRLRVSQNDCRDPPLPYVPPYSDYFDLIPGATAFPPVVPAVPVAPAAPRAPSVQAAPVVPDPPTLHVPPPAVASSWPPRPPPYVDPSLSEPDARIAQAASEVLDQMRLRRDLTLSGTSVPDILAITPKAVSILVLDEDNDPHDYDCTKMELEKRAPFSTFFRRVAAPDLVKRYVGKMYNFQSSAILADLKADHKTRRFWDGVSTKTSHLPAIRTLPAQVSALLPVMLLLPVVSTTKLFDQLVGHSPWETLALRDFVPTTTVWGSMASTFEAVNNLCSLFVLLFGDIAGTSFAVPLLDFYSTKCASSSEVHSTPSIVPYLLDNVLHQLWTTLRKVVHHPVSGEVMRLKDLGWAPIWTDLLSRIDLDFRTFHNYIRDTSQSQPSAPEKKDNSRSSVSQRSTTRRDDSEPNSNRPKRPSATPNPCIYQLAFAAKVKDAEKCRRGPSCPYLHKFDKFARSDLLALVASANHSLLRSASDRARFKAAIESSSLGHA